MDTNGVCCRHSETSFDYGVEITVESDGEKFSGSWWDAASRLAELDAAACGREALARAVGQIGSEPAPSGRYTAVIDAEMASRIVSPVLRALSGYSIQQHNSFLMDSLGQQVFPEGLTILDVPRIPGQTCSKYFDSEGVATVEAPVIERGVVKQYFINTYMSHKMQMAPTVEDATRPKVLPWPVAGLDRDAILRRCGSGILVTDFNGGNSNPVTGDFSYGIEGYLFEDGRIVRPVSGMLMTGNFLTLWARLLAAQPQFETHCDWRSVGRGELVKLAFLAPELFARKFPEGRWHDLYAFLTPLELARVLCDAPQAAEALDMDEICEKLAPDRWLDVLADQPQLEKYFDWRQVEGRPSLHWDFLLRRQPQFADHCDFSQLKSYQLRRILMTQPQFVDRVDWSKLEPADREKLEAKGIKP